MSKSRMEAFSDGVLAIIITIMVLEMKPPHGHDFAALRALLPVFLSYILSFVYIAIYWNNHHHLLHVARGVTGATLWANLHLLFWLSLIPFLTAWVDEHHGAPVPTAAYGFVLLMAGVAYNLLQRAILAHAHAEMARAFAHDWKGYVSVMAYAAAIPLAFVSTWIAHSIYVGIALWWLVPDRRAVHALAAHEQQHTD
jgi:uncharacterized membrane protein